MKVGCSCVRNLSSGEKKASKIEIGLHGIQLLRTVAKKNVTAIFFRKEVQGTAFHTVFDKSKITRLRFLKHREIFLRKLEKGEKMYFALEA